LTLVEPELAFEWTGNEPHPCAGSGFRLTSTRRPRYAVLAQSRQLGRARVEWRSGSCTARRRPEPATFGVTGRTKFNGINDRCNLLCDQNCLKGAEKLQLPNPANASFGPPFSKTDASGQKSDRSAARLR
jgi:hypothetical protein